MKEKEKIEYRKASAEALGFLKKEIEWHNEKTLIKESRLAYYRHDELVCLVEHWQPDKDANQREMIEDWLIEQGCWIYCTYNAKEKRWRIKIYRKTELVPKSPLWEDTFNYKFKSTAFRRAFMEYTKQKQ